MSYSTTADKKFIRITACLVLLLGIRTATSLLETDDVEVAQLESSSMTVVKSASAVPSTSGRQPASVHGQLDVEKGNLLALLKLDISCGKKTEQNFHVQGHYFQLKGKPCLKNFNHQQLSVQNVSNGYTASLFNSGLDTYQTDMIQLSPGANHITIQYSSPNGERFEQKLIVHSDAL